MNPMQQNIDSLTEGGSRQHSGTGTPPSKVAREILTRLFADYRGSTAIRLWDPIFADGWRWKATSKNFSIWATT